MVVVDLPAAYVGYKAVKACRSSEDAGRVAGALAVLIEGHTQVALERERRLTIALVLKQLPSGSCLLVRDTSGRKWYIGPADRAVTRELEEAA